METKMPSGHTDVRAFLNERAKSAQIYTSLKGSVSLWDRERLRNHYLGNDSDAATNEAFRWLHDKYFKGAKKILDVGCGNGLAAFGFRLNIDDVTVIGVDGSSVMIDLCREIKDCHFPKDLRIDFAECLAEDLSMFGDNTFDVVFSQHFLEHATCPEKVLQEMKRVAKNVCGFLPWANSHDCPAEHLWHWEDHSLRELMKKVFDDSQIEVRKFGGDILAYACKEGREMISQQGAGMELQEYKDFEHELFSTLKDGEKGECLRPWEHFAVHRNAELKESDNVLEFGAAYGYGCVVAAKYVDKLIVSDSWDWVKNRPDFDDNRKQNWIDRIQAYVIPNIEVKEVDIQATDYPDKTFDKVISYGSFEHVVDDAKGLVEMCRVLRDHGRVSMTIDFKYGDALPYNQAARGRVYNRDSITQLVENSPLRFLENPFGEWWKRDRGTADVSSIFALAVVLVKR